MSIAALIITKNEEQNIGDCLESVKWMDVRIVVDACSSDRTVEIAQSMGARVFTRP
ncbi:MAG: glycosyltransferase, partial [Nitrospirae bacterium]|nr:glycosyltransferase [Nitrospirota bacterium]